MLFSPFLPVIFDLLRAALRTNISNMIEIGNNSLSAGINPLGAELSSLRFRGREYLWQGSPDSWNGRSPHLFPVIGSCPEGGWKYGDKSIVLGNHGFARRREFETVSLNESSCTLRLKDSEGTLAQYPFPFVLDISFSVNPEGLDVSYRVENSGESVMLFSLGAHPGFNCPLEEGLDFEDYYLEFNRPETVARRIKAAFLTGEIIPTLNDEARLPLNFDMFDNGAYIFSDLASDSVILKSDKGSASVRMDFTGFPDFGVWTKEEAKAPYVCLEPWYGVDSSVGDEADFEKKEGLIRLAQGKEFRCSYSLQLS